MQRGRAEDPSVVEDGLTPDQSRLGDRYELGAVLGHGGMAVVRLGTDLRLGRPVAVKILLHQLTDDPEFQVRFRREARAAAALDHPAIVTVYDAGEDTADDVVRYIVMEYVEGHTLRQLLGTEPRLPARRALEIIADVLDALAYSHRRGIVHRDIKPGNVMVTPSGAVKVMDFGIARAATDMSGSLTRTSAVLGTAQYLSPEQARGDSADARSDVYAVGCVLYELLTGRPPFQAESAVAVAYQHVREAPQPPSAFEPTVSPEVDAVVLAALAKLPDERYQSADEMRAGILAVLSGDPAEAATTPIPAVPGETTAELRPVTADPDTAEQAVVDPRRRRRVGYLVAAAAVLLLLALGGFALSGPGGDPDRDQESGPGEGPAQTSTEPDESRSLEPAGAPYDPRVGGTPEQSGPSDAAEPETTDGDASPTTDPEPDDTPEPTQDSDPTSSPTSPTPSTPEEETTSETSPSETQSTETSEPEPEPSAVTTTP